MISLAQIKAARALLNWTQDTLAKAAGLSLPAINNLERGLTSPRKETLTAIEIALGTAGIEFLDTSGVRLKTPDVHVKIIEGPDWLATYDHDIFSVLQSSQDEILHIACDNRLWMIYGSTTNHEYVTHRNKVQFSERILVPDTIDYITSPAKAYRTLPSHHFARIDTQIYGDRVAHIIWDSRKIILSQSAALAESERLRFEILWALAKPFTPTQLNRLEIWDGSSSEFKSRSTSHRSKTSPK
mgnify:CR=1 FL=1